MGNYDDRRDPTRAARHRVQPGGLVLAVVIALLVGLGGGYLLWNRTSGSNQSAPPVSSPTVTATTPPPSGPATCVGVADDGAQLLNELKEAVKAIGNLDPQALEQVLNRMQQIQGELQQTVAACRDQFGGAVSNPPAPSTR